MVAKMGLWQGAFWLKEKLIRLKAEVKLKAKLGLKAKLVLKARVRVKTKLNPNSG